jgi:hypothetical protein
MTLKFDDSSRWFTRILLVGVLLGAAARSAPAALTDGLVAHWPMETISGGVTPDEALDNHLSVVGTPAGVAGQFGNAFLLDGASTYFTNYHGTEPTATGLPIYRAGGYTVAMWVKGAPQTIRYLYSEGSTTSGSPLFILQTGQAAANNAKLDVIIRTDAGGGGTPVNHRVSVTDVFDDTWHHIAWVDVDGAASLYVDGVLDEADFNYAPVEPFTFNTTAVGTLARADVSTGAIFNGAIDEVAVWNRALTEEEINQVRTAGIPITSEVFPPAVTSGLEDVTVRTGDWHFFRPQFSGTRPFAIQWFLNGAAIPDATNETYRVFNLTTNNTGDFYSLTASNSAGGITTTNATITVLADPAPAVRDGLVNYWPLNEILQEGEILLSRDLYSGNDMVLLNFLDPSDVAPGQFGNALFFDFVSKYAYRTNGSPIYNNTNYSVSLWVKAPFETQNDRRVFSEGSSVDADPLFTLGTDAAGTSPSVRVFIRNDVGANAAVTGRSSTRAVFDDEWHHVVWTDANGDGKLYVDGVLDETDYGYTRTSLSLDITSLGAVLRAGAGNFYFGALDEVAAWNRVLSWTEIQEIRTEGIPAPLAAIPPAITAQPTSRTNGVFAGDTVSIPVQYSGTLPLTFQWHRNGEVIASAQNPSAGTETLVLMNVQPADSGDFFVIITNVAGAVTSSVARLEVTPHTPPASGEVLKLDVGLTTAPNAQPGFTEFNLGMNGTNFNGVGVTFSGIGGAGLADRNRVTGAVIANNPPDMTQAQIYNDFIFANSTTDGTGLRIRIHRLAPNTPHELTLWSYDPQSAGGRVSDWSETSSGTPIAIQTEYTFDGSVQPVNDFEYTMTATLTSSPEGELVIEGIRNGGTSVAAFVNALRLVANPGAPTLSITRAELVNERLRVTVPAPAEGQSISFEQTAEIADGSWMPAADAAVVENNDTIVVFEFPVTAPRLFYRAVATP